MKSILLTVFLLGFASVGFGQSPVTNPEAPEDRNAEDVISIYGATYENISGINYDPNWGQTGHTQVNPQFDPGTGQVILAYPNFNYQGTDFAGNPFNASNMEYLHVDIWVAEGVNRMVKVTPVDNSGVGPSEVLVQVPVTPGQWNSVDIPLGDFTNMSLQSVFQLKFDGQFNADSSANSAPFDVYLDNIYFWRTATTEESDASLSNLEIDGETIAGFNPDVRSYSIDLPAGSVDVPQITLATPTNENASVTINQATGVPGEASVQVVSENGENEWIYTVTLVGSVPGDEPPVQPERNAADVISIFSDAYDDIEIDSYSAEWDDSEFEFVQIGESNTMRIDFGNFIGIDFQSDRQDMSEMTHFHMNFWTSNDTFDKSFNLKFSEWGGTAGEVSAFEYSLTNASDPPLEDEGVWVTVDIPLDSWTPINAASVVRGDVAQFVITSNLDVVYVANMYVYREGEASANATLSNLEVDGEPIAGFDPSVLNYTFNVPDGTTDAPQITLATPTNSNASVTITQATEIPGQASVQVVSEDGESESVYTVDFDFAPMAPVNEPPAQPERNAADVISIFSDAYDDIEIDSYSAEWDDSEFEFVQIGESNTMRIDFGNFIGIDFQSDRQDMSEMTHFHMNFWTSNDTFDKSFNLKFSEWGGTAGEVSAFEYSLTNASDPPLEDEGVWVTVDIPLDSWTPINAASVVRGDVAQFVITSNLDEVYIANVYVYREGAVSTKPTDRPEGFELRQNYPNPFNPTTNISYSTPSSGDVSLEVFNLMGQRVATLVNGVQTAGSHTITFDATHLSSGVYMYRLNFEGSVQTRQMLLIK